MSSWFQRWGSQAFAALSIAPGNQDQDQNQTRHWRRSQAQRPKPQCCLRGCAHSGGDSPSGSGSEKLYTHVTHLDASCCPSCSVTACMRPPSRLSASAAQSTPCSANIASSWTPNSPTWEFGRGRQTCAMLACNIHSTQGQRGAAMGRRCACVCAGELVETRHDRTCPSTLTCGSHPKHLAEARCSLAPPSPSSQPSSLSLNELSFFHPWPMHPVPLSHLC